MPTIDTLLKFGRCRAKSFTTTSTGAATTSVSIRPAGNNVLWLVLTAYGYHTAGGARNCDWYFSDAIDTSASGEIYPTASIAANAAWYSNCLNDGVLKYPEIIPCSYQRYLSFRFVATGAGEIGYVKTLLLELPFVKGV